MRHMIKITSLALLGLTVTGCASASKRLGASSKAPNEFNILTKAPLVVPPEYSLRPPRIGESSVENNYSQEAARRALVGDVDSAEPSQGEIMLLAKSGANRANKEIRIAIDGQNSVERKTKNFADRVLFWERGPGKNPDGSPLDAEAEAKRIKSINAATGGGQVQISRRPGTAKLPGL